MAFWNPRIMVSNPMFFDVVAEEYVSLQKDAEGPVDRSPNSRAIGDSQVIFFLGMSKRLVVPQCLVRKHCCVGYLKHIKMSKPKRNPFCSGWSKFSSKFISYLTPGCLYQRFFLTRCPARMRSGSWRTAAKCHGVSADIQVVSMDISKTLENSNSKSGASLCLWTGTPFGGEHNFSSKILNENWGVEQNLLVAHVRNHSAWHPGNVIFDNLDGTFALVSLFRLVEWGQENMLKSGLVLHEPFLGDVQPCFTHSGLVVPTFHRDTPLRYCHSKFETPETVWLMRGRARRKPKNVCQNDIRCVRRNSLAFCQGCLIELRRLKELFHCFIFEWTQHSGGRLSFISTKALVLHALHVWSRT